jgi:hypothetical protein
MSENTVNVVWMDRVVVRENGVAIDKPHQFNEDTGTCAVRGTGSDVEREHFDAGVEVGFYMAMQQMPQETIDRLTMKLPMLDVNVDEMLEEDDGLFG